jgi:hypothetical protein
LFSLVVGRLKLDQFSLPIDLGRLSVNDCNFSLIFRTIASGDHGLGFSV